MAAVDPYTAAMQFHALYSAALAQLAQLPVASASEGGRSLSVSAADIRAKMDLYAQQAAALGYPIGTVAEPGVIFTRARP